jgi:hypothetical protein
MKSTIAALALQIGTVLGAPASSIIPALSARDDDYIYGPNEGESARIAYGDSNFRFGHLVPSSTLDVIRDQCSDLGCDAGQTFEHTAFMVNSDVGRDVGITMTVDTEFNGVSSEDRPGSKAHLLALAKAAFEEVYESGAGTREEGVVYTKDPCPPSQVHGCPGKSLIGIRISALEASVTNTRNRSVRRLHGPVDKHKQHPHSCQRQRRRWKGYGCTGWKPEDQVHHVR